MVKQQVDLSRVVTRDEFPLPTQEGEAVAHLQKQVGDATAQGLFQLMFVVNRMADGGKAEVVVFFQHFLYKTALQCRQMLGEVVRYLAFVLVELGFDAVE